MPARTRARLIRVFGATVGKNVRINPLRVTNATWQNLSIAQDVYVGEDVLLDLKAPLLIGRGAVIAARAIISTHQDAGAAHGSPTAQAIGVFQRGVTVGEFAFIGTGAIVLAGANIGPGAVVGAGAVVVSDVRPGVHVGGVPARPLAV